MSQRGSPPLQIWCPVLQLLLNCRVTIPGNISAPKAEYKCRLKLSLNWVLCFLSHLLSGVPWCLRAWSPISSAHDCKVGAKPILPGSGKNKVIKTTPNAHFAPLIPCSYYKQSFLLKLILCLSDPQWNTGKNKFSTPPPKAIIKIKGN